MTDVASMDTPSPASGVHIEKPAGPGHTGEWSKITAAATSQEAPSHGTIRIDLGKLARTIEVAGVVVQKLGPTMTLALVAVWILPPLFDRVHAGYKEIAADHKATVKELTGAMDKQNSQTERALDKLSASLDKLADRMFRGSTTNPKGP